MVARNCDLDTLLTALYVLIDDHIIESGPRQRGGPRTVGCGAGVPRGGAGAASGRPVGASLAAAVLWAAGPSVPYLPRQPGYHKRVKAAAPLICKATMYLASLCPSQASMRLWMRPRCRAAPRGRRSGGRSWPGGELRLLRLHSRWYWGLKLYLITTAEGMPVAWCLADPKIGEREVAAELLGHARDTGALRDQMIVLADKGLAGREMEHWPTARSTCCWPGPTVKTNGAGSATWPACASG